MKNKKNTAPVESTSNLQELNDSAEAQVIAEATEKATTEPKIKETPVEERKYRLTEANDNAELKFRGKQRQAVYQALRELKNEPSTISEVAQIAEALELKAVGGTEPSVRYHLHHMTKDGITEVVNPTITVE
jgi:hypothetical protein